MITPCLHTRHCRSGVHQLPCPGSLQPQYIHVAQMCLQEKTPKIPCKCIKPQPCINLARAQKSAMSSKPCSGFIFVAASCCSIFLWPGLELSNPSLSLYPAPRPCSFSKSDVAFHHPPPNSQGINIRLWPYRYTGSTSCLQAYIQF